jgi:carboxymethylenebutenolidase
MTYPYEGQIAETVTFPGDKGFQVEAYAARPTGPGPFGGVVVIHAMPGWDAWAKEVVRKLAHRGFNAISHHLFCRFGPGSPDDLAAKARGAGGTPDDEVVADTVAAAAWLRGLATSNGRVGVMGFCSGGRQTYLTACRSPQTWDAAVDCWGGNVVVDNPGNLTPQRPVAPVDYTADLRAPLLGIFGNDDKNPSPDNVDRLEAALRQHGKTYEFHRYDGAGHGFFAANRDNYRVAQANDGWEKVFAFWSKHLG